MTSTNTKFDGVKFYDTHTLYIKCSIANEDQLAKSLNRAIMQAKYIVGPDIDTRYKINMVKNKQQEFIGIAYVRVQDPRIYHMLLGKNPDGSDRVEEKYDREWREPTQEEVDEVEYKISQIPNPEEDPDWEDIQEDWGEMDYRIGKYEHLVEEIRKTLYPTKILVKLPPLISLDNYVLDKNQHLRYINRQIVKNKDNPHFNPDTIEIPESLPFTVDRAATVQINVKQLPHVLKAVNIPQNITAGDLKNLFSPFASDPNTLYHWKVMGVASNEPYPYVYLDKNRTASIIFDPKTNDAEFALFLTKQTPVKGVDRNGRPISTTIWFSHSFVVDRDVPKEITRMTRPQEYNPPRQQEKSVPKLGSGARTGSYQSGPDRNQRYASKNVQGSRRH